MGGGVCGGGGGRRWGMRGASLNGITCDEPTFRRRGQLLGPFSAWIKLQCSALKLS